jgi:surface carbohydrate biosynthesis protein
MLSLIKKIWRYFTFLTFSRKLWSLPKQSDVLIYDACNMGILLEHLKPWYPEVLHVRGEQINIRVFFSSLFRSGSKWGTYIDCYIEKVRPRLVVTFIDNSLEFYSISARHPGIKTLFIQNGVREIGIFKELARRVSSGESFTVDNMMPFGDCVGAEYAKYIQGCVR